MSEFLYTSTEEPSRRRRTAFENRSKISLLNTCGSVKFMYKLYTENGENKTRNKTVEKAKAEREMKEQKK